MTIDDQIRDERLQYDINKEAAKISALLSGKLDKCEYLTSKVILPSNQKKKKKKKKKKKEQAKFAYSPLGNTFETQIKTIEDKKEDK